MEQYDFTLQHLVQYRLTKPTTDPLPVMLLTEPEVLHIATSIANGLLHIHNNGFVHR
jgi:serine/threonine protein kinase